MSSTRRVVKIAERYNKKIHVLHVTTKEEVEFLSRYKGNVTFEITPQHLTISSSTMLQIVRISCANESSN